MKFTLRHLYWIVSQASYRDALSVVIPLPSTGRNPGLDEDDLLTVLFGEF